MKIKYRYVTGETAELEVDDALGAELTILEKQQANRDRAERRRHWSLDAMLEAAYPLAEGSFVSEIIERADMKTQLAMAVDQLTEKQRRLVYLLYVEGLSVTEAAQLEQVSHQVISRRHATALKKLKEILTDRVRNGSPRG